MHDNKVNPKNAQCFKSHRDCTQCSCLLSFSIDFALHRLRFSSTVILVFSFPFVSTFTSVVRKYLTMKVFKVLLLLLKSVEVFCALNLESEVAVRTINGMLGSYLTKHNSTVVLESFGKTNGQAQAMCEKILRTKPDNVTITYVTASNHDTLKIYQPSTSAIVIFVSVQLFYDQARNIVWMANSGVLE